MKLQYPLSVLLITCCAALSACSTVKMPRLDLLGSNAFSEDVKNIDTSIPDVSEAPAAPTDVRSTQEWDKSAQEIISVRENFVVPESEGNPLTDEDIEAEFEAKKNKVHAYKLDDPIE